jgi:hypothetical protein
LQVTFPEVQRYEPGGEFHDPACGRTAGELLLIMRGTHRAAAQFLCEIAPTYPAGK